MIDCVQSLPGVCQASPLLNASMIPIRSAAEHGAGQVADAAQDGGGERDQADAEALVEADVREVEGVEQTGRAGERAGEQEREGDRAVDVDAHHRRGIAVLRRRAHRLPLSRSLHEPDQREQHGHGDQPGRSTCPTCS